MMNAAANATSTPSAGPTPHLPHERLAHTPVALFALHHTHYTIQHANPACWPARPCAFYGYRSSSRPGLIPSRWRR